MIPQAIAAFIMAAFLSHMLRLFIRYVHIKESLKEIQGPITWISNNTTLSSVFYNSSLFVLGQYQFWTLKHELYKGNGWDISAALSLWPDIGTSLIIGNASLFKEICSNHARFVKPVDHYEPLAFFGPNIVASEGEEWKKYRKICSSAFSEKNNKRVWDESIKMVEEFFDDVWCDGRQQIVDNFTVYSLQFALRVIAAAGFGKRMSWKSYTTIPSGHQMSFEDTFRVVSNDVFIKLLVPDWLASLTPRTRRVKLAFDELKLYLQEMINDRRFGHSINENADLFSNLLDANEDANRDVGVLDDSELISNMFMFILAAHQTSAHTLTFVFALLALYPDEQEKLYRHIVAVSPNKFPAYSELPVFTRTMAVFNETLRLFPPVINEPKYSAEDTQLVATNSDGTTLAIPVAKGTPIVLHAPGVHYNPRYWKNPKDFQPDRFLGDWPKDAFVPFSSGPRACLGRRFSEISNIAIITVLVLHYRVAIKEEPKFKTETFQERRERVTKAVYGITNTPVRVPLIFVRRE